jgi:hypothetical protein
MVDIIDPKSAFPSLSSIDKLKPLARQHNSMNKKKNNRHLKKKDINEALDKGNENNPEDFEISSGGSSDFINAKDNKIFSKKLIDIKI